MDKLHNIPYLLQGSTNCKATSVAFSILQSDFSSFIHSVSNIPIVSKPYLWHLRLGHASNNKLNALHSAFPDVVQFHSNKDCILCPIAKQKKLPLPSFNHLFDHVFDIINCDVWGPFAKPTQEGLKYFLTIMDDATKST